MGDKGVRGDRGRPILFFSRDPGGVQTLLPVIREMKTGGQQQVLVISHPASFYLYERHGIETIPVAEAQGPGAQWTFFRTVLEKYGPSVTVTGTSVPHPEEGLAPEQILIITAKRAKVPVLCILDFWGRYIDRFPKYGNRLWKEVLPDTICALDSISRNDLIALGIEEKRIRITHNPYFDDVLKWSKARRHSPPHEIHSDKRNILFISQPIIEYKIHETLGYSQETLFDMLVYALEHWQEGLPKHVILWMHPKERRGRWRKKIQDLPRGMSLLIIEKPARPPQLLSHADLIVTSHSTVVYEALYYNTPCVSVQIGKKTKDQLITNRLNLSIPIYSQKALHEFFSSLDLTTLRQDLKRKQDELASKQIFFSDGRATHRVLHAIQEMKSLHDIGD